MALRNMPTAQMVNVTSPWLDPAHPDRQALERIPAVKGVLPHVAAAHQGLLDTQVDRRAEWLAALRSDQRVLGRRHRYREKAGYAALLAARLTAQDEAALAALPMAHGSLLDLVRECIEVAGKISELEHRRHSSAIPKGSSTRARGKWIRVVNTMRVLIDTIGPEDPVIDEIVRRLEGASRQAGRRVAAGNDDAALADAAPVTAPATEPVTTAPAAEPANGPAPAAGAERGRAARSVHGSGAPPEPGNLVALGMASAPAPGGLETAPASTG